MRRFHILFLVFVLLLPISQVVLSKSSSELSEELSGIIPKRASRNGKLGILVKSLKTNEKIFEYNSDELFIPASNAKVIVSVTALSLLKPEYRFKTEFYSGGKISGGVLQGGLYIKGYGDPTLSTERLRSIANEFKKMGIKQVAGGIIVDDSYFDGVRYGKGWKKQWEGDVYSPAISALSLNYNTLDLNVYPSKLDRIPIISTEPQGANVNIINKAVTNNRRSRLMAVWLEEGKTIMLQGSISPRVSSYTFKLTVGNPAAYTGSVFKKTLEEAGITVQGFVSSGAIPNLPKVFYTSFSDPLYMIVAEYNKNSVNIIGENITKTLGAQLKGTPGTWDKGTEVISEFLSKIGIKDGFEIVDGSGLSPLNRVSPYVLTEVLKYAYKNQLISSQFLNSLSIGGVDGTLKRRFRRSEVEGKIMAKTGHLNNVNTLSGYLFTNSGDVLVFSILANGLGSKAKEIQNHLLVKLVECCDNNHYRIDSNLKYPSNSAE
ncbi:MAG: D-alanyl-D-alanine carboxypeptidase/D-alanyl-D-alanine-endopeptidase [Ignavibacteriales bacterium]